MKPLGVSQCFSLSALKTRVQLSPLQPRSTCSAHGVWHQGPSCPASICFSRLLARAQRLQLPTNIPGSSLKTKFLRAMISCLNHTSFSETQIFCYSSDILKPDCLLPPLCFSLIFTDADIRHWEDWFFHGYSYGSMFLSIWSALWCQCSLIVPEAWPWVRK